MVEAEQTFRRIGITSTSDYGNVLERLSRVYAMQGEDLKAQAAVKKCLTIRRNNAYRYSSIQTEKQQLNYSKTLKQPLDILLSTGLRLSTDLSETYQSVMNYKGSIVERQRAIRVLSSKQEAGNLFHALQRTTSDLAAHFRNMTHPTVWETQSQDLEWETRRQELVSQIEQLEKKLAKALDLNSKPFRIFTLKQLYERLPESTVLVDFIRFSYSTVNPKKPGELSHELHYLAFVVHSDGQVVAVDLGEAERVDRAIEAWRERFGKTNLGLKAGRELRMLIWEPIQRYFRDKKEILISPDGNVSLLPFNALPDLDRNSFLIEKYEISIIPSSRLLKDVIEKPARNFDETPSLLVIGNINYGSGTRYPSLPETQGEIEKVAAAFKMLVKDNSSERIKEVSKNAATAEFFMANLNKFQYLHIATHGYFAEPDSRGRMWLSSDSGDFEQYEYLLGLNPAQSAGLVFANANQPVARGSKRDDGIVTAQDISYLPMNNVKLAVLSACETGLGKIADGEGLLGLQRSFQIAGARSVVSSLWSVDSWATRLLMERFYHNLWVKKMATREALREAQLWMLRNPKELTAKMNESGIRGIEKVKGREIDEDDARTPPFYWAAWTLSGDWE